MQLTAPARAATESLAQNSSTALLAVINSVSTPDSCFFDSSQFIHPHEGSLFLTLQKAELPSSVFRHVWLPTLFIIIVLKMKFKFHVFKYTHI